MSSEGAPIAAAGFGWQRALEDEVALRLDERWWKGKGTSWSWSMVEKAVPRADTTRKQEETAGAAHLCTLNKGWASLW